MSAHRTHCCRKHGCKYGEEDCPVVTGKETGIICEECKSKKEEEVIVQSKMLIFPHSQGVRLQWTDENGYFGEIDILLQDMFRKNTEIHSETMGKEFVKKVFAHLIDNAELVS